MKFPLFFAATLPIALGLVSCDTESSYERHQTAFLNLNPSGRLLYADQTIDTLRVYSTDSWTLSVQNDSSRTWLTASPTVQEVKTGQALITPIVLTAQINTTGKYRSARVNIASSYSAQYGVGMPLTQLPFHNISRPGWTISAEQYQRGVLPTFSETLSSESDTTKVVFTLYNPGDTLVSSAAWLSVDAAAAKPKRGENSAQIIAAPNMGSQPRTATVTLSASGVSTTIIYTQAGKP